jgi:hypothetical protein
MVINVKVAPFPGNIFLLFTIQFYGIAWIMDILQKRYQTGYTLKLLMVIIDVTTVDEILP